MAEFSDQESIFVKELDDEFELQMPGYGTKPVSVSDNESLVRMLSKVYPEWKEDGRVTSVPIARMPQLFLHNLAMCKDLERTLKGTQKGDFAERKLYKLFVQGNFPGQPGMIVFPNVNGSQIFKSQVAKVEIDMVLVHQLKGVFIFNVKNVGGSTLSSEKLQKDIDKHKQFIRLLMEYKTDLPQMRIPIHSIVCNFQSDANKFKDLEEKTNNLIDKTFVFNKKDLNPAHFSKFWIEKMSSNELQTVEYSCALEIFVARLVALNSLESSLALIHDQLRRGLMQSMNDQKHLQSQITSVNKDEKFRDMITEFSGVRIQKGKKKFILWTKEQIKIISHVYDGLNSFAESDHGMRVLVEGCRGSGKTMLLVFIAKLARRILYLRRLNRCGKKLICHGLTGNPVLIQHLQKEFESGDFLSIKLVGNPKFYNSLVFRKLGDDKSNEEMKQHLESAEILLCDEFSYQKGLLELLRDNQHCVLFTSFKFTSNAVPISSEIDKFITFSLSFSLRSTCAIANFAFGYMKHCHSSIHLSSRPAHNFEGEPVDIKIVEEENFVATCVNTICQYSEKCSGLDTLPVLCFMDLEIRNLIINILISQDFSCSSTEFGMYLQQPGSPLVQFFRPRDVEGSEFGAVLILISFKHYSEIMKHTEVDFLTAITRASTKLSIIVNNEQLTNCQPSCTCRKDDYERSLDEIRYKSDLKSSHLLIGPKIPAMSDFVKSVHPPVRIPGLDVSQYVREEGGSFLYTKDVYKESHLEKLQEFGIQEIRILDLAFAQPFYLCTRQMIGWFSENRNHVFNIIILDGSNERPPFELLNVIDFCKFHANGKVGYYITEKHASKEPPDERKNRKHIKWGDWKEKASEAFRLKRTMTAFYLYNISLRVLDDEYEENLSHSNFLRDCSNDVALQSLHTAQIKRIEQAKLYTNLSLVSIELPAATLDGIEWYYALLTQWGDFNHGKRSIPHSMWMAIDFGLAAIHTNACWKKSYDRIDIAMKSLKTFFKKQREGIMNKVSNSSNDNALQHLIAEEKQNGSSIIFWTAADYPAAAEFNCKVLNYRRLLLSAAHQKELIACRKSISFLALQLSRESVEQELWGTEETKNDVPENIFYVIKSYKYKVRLALAALVWNPCTPEGYDILFATMSHMENLIKRLRVSIENRNERDFLQRLIRYEISVKASSSIKVD